jgi:formylmethanofuran dehydrogenase subunit C
MSSFTLRLRASPRFRIDVSTLTPDRLAGQKAGSIARLELPLGQRKISLGELFDVSGNAGDALVFEGDCERLDRIGAGLTDGTIRVEGNAGAYLGLAMRGGEIAVSGSAGAYAACGLAGGTLRIGGSAGEFLGAALPGEHRGMRGGVVIVRGNVADRAGDHMRRGLMLIEGNCGDYCGARMGGGTIALAGRCGQRPGYAMRRGTLLFCDDAPSPGPTFNDCGVQPLGFLSLLARSWRDSQRFASLAGSDVQARRWVGDLGFGGQGELLHWPG